MLRVKDAKPWIVIISHPSDFALQRLERLHRLIGKGLITPAILTTLGGLSKTKHHPIVIQDMSTLVMVLKSAAGNGKACKFFTHNSHSPKPLLPLTTVVALSTSSSCSCIANHHQFISPWTLSVCRESVPSHKCTNNRGNLTVKHKQTIVDHNWQSQPDEQLEVSTSSTSHMLLSLLYILLICAL